MAPFLSAPGLLEAPLAMTNVSRSFSFKGYGTLSEYTGARTPQLQPPTLKHIYFHDLTLPSPADSSPYQLERRR